MNEDPITDVCLVTDPGNCPGGYSLIDRTHDTSDDADLWKDKGFFGRKTRYLCYLKSNSVEGKTVLVDISLIGEKESKPHGYELLEYTIDTKERAMKKRQICLRYLSSTLTQDAISDVIVLSQSKRPPGGFTLVGDINNLQLCFKLSPIKTEKRTSQVTHPPYPVSPKTTTEQPVRAAVGTSLQSAPPHRQTSVLSKAYNPMSGVPWQINPRIGNDGFNFDGPLPDTQIKTVDAIENQYNYSFQVEYAAMDRLS